MPDNGDTPLDKQPQTGSDAEPDTPEEASDGENRQSPDQETENAGQDSPGPDGVGENGARHPHDGTETGQGPGQGGEKAGKPMPVVAVGASAGGLEALQELFIDMPVDTGASFVVVTHQQPRQKSYLPDILSRSTALEVVEAADGMGLRPNRIHVLPPGALMWITDGVLQLSEESGNTSPNLPVDYFFRSLANDRGKLAVGVVLSGTGSDGTLGLREIKGRDGMAMVQASASARFTGMPASAEGSGLADFVLEPREMPEQLVRYLDGPYLSTRPADEEPTTLSRSQISKIVSHVRKHKGQDFSMYKPKTMGRRIERRMNIHRMDDPETYERYIREHPREADLLFQELLIGVTGFFRDPPAFNALGAALLRYVGEKRQAGDSFRAWIPGCATGEEAYSLAILLDETLDAVEEPPRVQVFATDVDPRAVDKARQGVYGPGIEEDVSPERLGRYFKKEDNQYVVAKHIRENMVFATHNLIQDPPFINQDLVSCRNLLIYLESAVQKRLLHTFHQCLKEEGILFLGSSETIGQFDGLFTTLDGKRRIFRKQGGNQTRYFLMSTPGPHRASLKAPDDRDTQRQSSKSPPMHDFSHLLAKTFAPPCILVDQSGDIAYVHGRTGAFLEPSEGRPSSNILNMSREGLSGPLTVAVRRAHATGNAVNRNQVPVKNNGGYSLVDIRVEPVRWPEALKGLLLVSFVPTSQAAGQTGERESEPEAAQEDHQTGLEQELAFTKQSLQATIEDLETTNEELSASNEEMQSTNEELQSTNEELEASREELQSINEELRMANAELNSKVEELSRARNDMQNLLNNTRMAILFLDQDLRIGLYTDKAGELFHIIPSDTGRPLSDLASSLVYEGLISDCQEVLETLVPKEMEAVTGDGSWQQVRIIPYRTTENVIDGLVVSLVDVTRLKKAEKSLEFFDAIVQTVREPLVVLDADLRVVSANNAFYSTFRTDPGASQGKRIYDLGKGQWNIPELRNLLEEVLPEGDGFTDYRVEKEFPDMGRRTFLLNGRRLAERNGEEALILLAIEEHTTGADNDE
ncbi:MAG: chemotaxis protein CheB [Desulfatibacillaceae bacterium]